MSEVCQQWYELRNALEVGDFSAATSLVSNEPGLVHERNRLGETVLHFLAIENNQAAVQWLLGHGAELNVRNEFGTPLLFEVAVLGYRDLLVWLVEHGANLKSKSTDGLSIAEHLAEFGKLDMVTFINGRFTQAA